jgi:hypothetical protein
MKLYLACVTCTYVSHEYLCGEKYLNKLSLAKPQTGLQTYCYSYNLVSIYHLKCRSQWPRALRHELSSLARTLASNHTQGMNVCLRLCCACVVLCVGSGLATD